MIILGADRSGKSLLAGMLNCSREINYESLLTTVCCFHEFGYTKLDKLHAEFSSDEKFIWILRNPLESSYSMNKTGIELEKALSYWVDINTTIWYFLHSVPKKQKICVHFEDLLLSDSVISNIFDFCSIMFDKQYLIYGDFDQFIFNDLTFSSGVRDGEKVNFYEHSDQIVRQWDKVKNKKIVIQFGYTRR